jgi:predicted TIM-barrel fold metal-dependent hydrolase
MTDRPYDGPIIDSHFHLWRYDRLDYAWLAEEGLEPLRRDHLPEEFLDLFQASGITASVHIEAGRRPEDPVGETGWLSELDLPEGVGDRLVVHVPLHQRRATAIIEEQAEFDRVVGVRDILTWHPDPSKSRLDDNSRMSDPVWLANFALLGRHGWSFDVLMSPWQAADVYRLAMDHPETTLAINHCGSPIDRDTEGMRRWRESLQLLASAPNTVIKISDPVAFDTDWTAVSLSDVILTCIDIFGPNRAMFGSDHPVSGLNIGYARWVEIFAETLASLSRPEQEAVFAETARRVYQIDG